MPKPTTYKNPVIIALAATGPDAYRDKIVEIAAVTYQDGQRTDFFQEKAQDEGSTPGTLLQAFVDHVDGHSFFLAHNAERVRAFLRRATKERLKLNILDTRDIARICFPSLPSYELSELCRYLELPALAEHSPADVCENTTLLWNRLTDRIHELPTELLSEVDGLFSSCRNHPLKGFFRAICAETKHDGMEDGKGLLANLFRKEALPKRRRLPDMDAWEMLDADAVADIFGSDGPFAGKLKGYECRPQQADMARAVASAFNDSGHLIVEAGTGVGKSLAYLAPVVLWSSTNDTPVIVSTNTKNLQSQLFSKDLPLLREILDTDFKAVIIKGRRNYVCLRKLCYLLQHTAFELSRKERVSLACIVVWAASTKAGDVSECSACGAATRDDLRDQVTSDASECRGPDCDYRQRCFLFRARRKALSADVIIANHAVVFSEMEMDEGSPVLPPYRHIVFDEAHNLEDAATSWLSTEISTARLYYILRRMWRPGRRRAGSGLAPAVANHVDRGTCTSDPDLAVQASRCIDTIIAGIGAIGQPVEIFFGSLETLLTPASKKESVRIRADQKRESQWKPIIRAREELVAVLSIVMRATETLAETLQEMEGAGADERNDFVQDLRGVLERIAKFTEDIEFVLSAECEGYVFWVERASRRHGGIRAWGAPVRVGPLLLDHLYSKKDSVVLTSATLSVGGSQEFMKKRVGLDLVDKERLTEMNTGTPFDYARQCTVMVPLFLPNPADPAGDYVRQLGILLSEVFRRTRGRGMALFTSYDMLRRTSSVLREEMTDDGVQLLVQGESGSRENIIRVFKEDLKSVLMGTHSFWEGVDVTGESLSCLAVTKLPFAVFTDPIVEARCEQVEAEGQNAFMGFSLPNAVIRFRQGFGRLIRHKTDRGIVIVTDHRIVAKRYGHWFRNSLPTRTVKFPDRNEFLDAVEECMEPAEDDTA